MRKHARHLHRGVERQVASRSHARFRQVKKALRPQIGKATWYNLPGRITASGEPFRPRLPTAAHRTLPLLSYARVTNLKNGRSVVVLINDRGPEIHGRVIDLSEGAAEKLHMLRAGVVPVLVQPLSQHDTAEAFAIDQSALASATR